MAKALILLKDTLNLIKYILNVPETAIAFNSREGTNVTDTISTTKEIDYLNYLLNKTEEAKALVFLNDFSKDASLKSVYHSNLEIKSFIGLPITGLNKKVIGIFYVTYNTEESITKDQITALNSVLKQASKLILKNNKIKKYKAQNKGLTNKTHNQKEILSSTRAGAYIWNIQKDKITYNKRWAEIVGYTLKELRPTCYLTWKDLVHPDDKAMAEKAIQDYFAKKTAFYNVQFRLRHKKGHYVWVNSSGYVIKWTEDQQPILMVGSHLDITHQKESDDAIKKHNWHLEEIQRIAKIGSWSYDVATRKHIFSKGFNDIFGVDVNNSYKKAFGYVFEDDKAFVAQAKKECLESSTPYEITYRINNENGDERIIEENGSTIEDEKGAVISAQGTLVDITKRIKREQHLKLLESAIKNAKDSVLITEAEPFDEPGPKILYVNDAFTKMTGYTADEVIGKTPRILQGPKTNKPELRKLGKALRKWEPYEMTTINYKKNGDEFWINFSVTPVTDDKGWYTHWIAIERDVTEEVNAINHQKLFRDISYFFTEKKTTEESVKFSIKEIIRLLNYSYAELWILNKENNKLALVSAEHSDASGQTFKQLNTKTNYEFDQGPLADVIKNKKIIIWNDLKNHDHFERRENAKNAELTTAIGIPLKANNETLGVLLLMNKDQLKKSLMPIALFDELEHMLGKEIKRKNLEIEFNQVFNFAPGIITINNSKNFLTKVNPALVKILGYTEEELLSQPFYNFIHPDDKVLTENITEVLTSGKPIYNFENRYITKSGEVIWLNWAATPDFRNGLTYGVAQDVTAFKKNEAELIKVNNELKKYTKQLETSNSELEQFAYVASHDLQEPLRMVTSFLGQLERKYKPVLDEKGQSYIHYAVDGATRMRTTILDILEYSRVGNEDDISEDVDLNLTIEDVLGYYRNKIKSKNVKINCANLPTINIPKASIFRVFSNLIGNAIKYASTNRQPEIEISVEDKKSYWEFRVKDNGIGIEKEYFEKIFVIFQRLHGKGEYSGSGVGLSIVKKIVERNAGKIRVESEKYKGSTFFIQLPK